MSWAKEDWWVGWGGGAKNPRWNCSNHPAILTHPPPFPPPFFPSSPLGMHTDKQHVWYGASLPSPSPSSSSSPSFSCCVELPVARRGGGTSRTRKDPWAKWPQPPKSTFFSTIPRRSKRSKVRHRVISQDLFFLLSSFLKWLLLADTHMGLLGVGRPKFDYSTGSMLASTA